MDADKENMLHLVWSIFLLSSFRIVGALDINARQVDSSLYTVCTNFVSTCPPVLPGKPPVATFLIAPHLESSSQHPS